MQLINGTYSKEDTLENAERSIRTMIQFQNGKIALSVDKKDIQKRKSIIKQLQDDLSAFAKFTSSQQGSKDLDAQLRAPQSNAESSSYCLINGNFTIEDSLEILNSAFKSKINFNKTKAFSLQERGEPGSQLHRARAIELQNELDKISEELKINDVPGQIVNIHCSVRLDFVTAPEKHVSEPTIVHSH
ncbi:MAG TPA: hypothetical protein PLU73_10185 [Bacteroidia bacterium]|nr:hypothetical protein [Bacteroidia bacterium]